MGVLRLPTLSLPLLFCINALTGEKLPPPRPPRARVGKSLIWSLILDVFMPQPCVHQDTPGCTAHTARNQWAPGHLPEVEDTAVPTELCPDCWQVQPVTHVLLGTPVLILALALGGLSAR